VFAFLQVEILLELLFVQLALLPFLLLVLLLHLHQTVLLCFFLLFLDLLELF
jgi:hypothetical protein